ncbi:MAG: hypothetical protein CVT67_03045 [Actinobacteria bacterium HGW-Actinobacteria-7]|nr:MAG: hypothetical protein CVT67_03045 [Actinobacteria bacterium HGW-Actinobacteria-7]
MRDGPKGLRVLDLGEDEQELVAAHSGRNIIGPGRLFEPLADQPQQGVASVVTGRVVHRFKAVEIEQCDAELLALGVCGVNLPGEQIAEARPVGQAGQGVVVRQLPNAGFGAAPLEVLPLEFQVRQFQLLSAQSHRFFETGAELGQGFIGPLLLGDVLDHVQVDGLVLLCHQIGEVGG